MRALGGGLILPAASAPPVRSRTAGREAAHGSRILDDPSGTVSGKAALRSYFQRGLDVYPNLKFELLDVMWGLSSVVLHYVNQKGSRTGEYMEFGLTGKVFRVVANYTITTGERATS